MTFKRYNYCLQWYGKDVNESHLLGYPIEVDDPLDIKVLNTFFGMKIWGLPVKRINLSINGSFEEWYKFFREKRDIFQERFEKSLGGLFKCLN